LTTLKDFTDDGRGCFANVRMDNDDPCWISVASSGVIVKKSKLGLFGEKLYSCQQPGKLVVILMKNYQDPLTPPEMTNPVLQPITNAVLHCSTLDEVKKILNEVSM
jgi:hypothetical protein